MKEKIKYILKLLIVVILTYVATWGLFGFIVNNWNMAEWWEIGRILYIIIPLYISSEITKELDL